MQEVEKSFAKKRTAETMKRIGVRLRKEREMLGATQLDVAFYINADKCLISSLERGFLENTTLLTLVKLSILFNIALEDLVK